MKYLRVFTDFAKTLEPLKDGERGRLFTAMLEYAEQGTAPELSGNERYIWPTVKADIDRQIEAYEHKCQVNRINGASRSQSHPVAPSRTQSLQKTKTEDKEKKRERKDIKETPPDGGVKKSAPRFTPPSVSEVREYCQERGNAVDAERFVDFYSAKGWMVGKNHMKDWRAAVRTWERDERSTPAPEQKPSAEMEAWLRGEID